VSGRNRPGRVAATSLAVFSTCLAAMAAHAETRVNFVSCPIVRDTPSVPCWLSANDGELYYLGIQTDVSAEFHPPYLGHRVLVEGVVAENRERICGGVVLEPVRISVMPELDGTCNQILPVVPEYTIDFNPRPPGPSGGRLAFDPAPGAAPPPPPRPEGPRTFELYFEVDHGIAFGHPRDVLEIFDYAQKLPARTVSLHAPRGATRLSNGELLVESPGVAERRVNQVADLLRGLGLDADIRTSFDAEPAAADGIDDWQSRSVEVRVEP